MAVLTIVGSYDSDYCGYFRVQITNMVVSRRDTCILRWHGVVGQCPTAWETESHSVDGLWPSA